MNRRILPGFGLTLGLTVLYLSLVVILPIGALLLKASQLSLSDIAHLLSDARTLHALKVSFFAAFLSAVINGIVGFLIAWVLARYSFFGKKLLEIFLDVPFALPTAVAGIALTATYAPNGPIGLFLSKMNIYPAIHFTGIVLALTFVGFPFVVRTLEPVLKEFEKEQEEAAHCLGANAYQTFLRVIFPYCLPAWMTGMTLAFARALGEYGSVVFISANIPMRTEIAPFLIMIKLEQYDYNGAIAIAVILLVMSMLFLLLMNLLQFWKDRHHVQLK